MSLVRWTRCAITLTLALAWTSACSDLPSSERTLPDDVSASVGVKGGRLAAAGVTLDIPEGALDKTVKISATNLGQTAPAQMLAKQLSDVYEFGPDGTKFNKDVTVTFVNKSMSARAEVYFTKEDGSGFERINSTKQGGEVVARVKHFSQGFLGEPLDEPLDADDAGESDGIMDGGTIAPDSSVDPAADASADMDAAADAFASDAGTIDATAPDSAVATTRIVVNTRDVYGALVNQSWAAFQDGKGAWQALPTPANRGVYEFDVASAVFAVALVCSSPDQANSWGTLRYATTASSVLELGTPGSVCTAGTPPLKHRLSGKLIVPSGYWYWRYGHAYQYSPINLYSGGNPDFTASELIHDELNDIAFATGPGTFSYSIGKLGIRRDVRPTADVDAGFDFDLMDGGVAPLSTTAQAEVLGGTTDGGSVDVHYLTRATELGMWLNTSATSGTGARVASFATLPEGIRRSTDLYLVRGKEEVSNQWRAASLATYPSGSFTLSLPPTFSVVFSAEPSPYLRPSFGFTQVVGASKYVFSLSYSPVVNSNHLFDIELDPGWLDTPSAIFTFPDFSQLPGFSTSWVAPAAGAVSAKAAVHKLSNDGKTTLKDESGQSATVRAP